MAVTYTILVSPALLSLNIYEMVCAMTEETLNNSLEEGATFTQRGINITLVQEKNVMNYRTSTLKEGNVLINNMNGEDSDNFSTDPMRLRVTVSMRIIGQSPLDTKGQLKKFIGDCRIIYHKD
ncbi:hypothetical protein CEXT_219871 [Caerostris extrusa]|uniref:Uncharacterized protein n=1 Tax=Caerostris extrusa TaxID=172846 RepID=A0AAV4NZQ4_CAEEX|nr:hypothetical protein CEXT_219871 [Caerostris extrusa]